MLSLGQIGPEQITWQNLKRQYACAFSPGPSVILTFTALLVSIAEMNWAEMKSVIIYSSLYARDVSHNVRAADALLSVNDTVKLQKGRKSL